MRMALTVGPQTISGNFMATFKRSGPEILAFDQWFSFLNLDTVAINQSGLLLKLRVLLKYALYLSSSDDDKVTRNVKT